jgi:hypothetical protein
MRAYSYLSPLHSSLKRFPALSSEAPNHRSRDRRVDCLDRPPTQVARLPSPLAHPTPGPTSGESVRPVPVCYRQRGADTGFDPPSAVLT